MNDIQLKAEIWEVQVWVMWIFAFALYETKHFVLFGMVLTWSIISFIGVLIKAYQGKQLEIETKNTHPQEQIKE